MGCVFSGARMPILSRLMQAMRDGVTGDDLLNCSDDIIDSDASLNTDDDDGDDDNDDDDDDDDGQGGPDDGENDFE